MSLRGFFYFFRDDVGIVTLVFTRFFIIMISSHDVKHQQYIPTDHYDHKKKDNRQDNMKIVLYHLNQPLMVAMIPVLIPLSSLSSSVKRSQAAFRSASHPFL